MSCEISAYLFGKLSLLSLKQDLTSVLQQTVFSQDVKICISDLSLPPIQHGHSYFRPTHSAEALVQDLEIVNAL